MQQIYIYELYRKYLCMYTERQREKEKEIDR